MKLAVFSDVHGNLTALEAALRDIEAQGELDMVWFLGDLAAFGPRPAECIRRVKAWGEALGEKKFRAIGGNTDRYLVTGERFKKPGVTDEDAFKGLLAQREAIDARLNWNLSKLSWEDYQYLDGLLGKEAHLRVKDYGTVIGYHAVPGNDETMLTPDTSEEEAADALLDREGSLAIGGHIHVQMDRQIRNNWRVINVGSVGMSFDMPGKAQWGLFTFEGGAVQVDLRAVPYDVDAAVADLHATGHPSPDAVEKILRGS